MSLNFINILYQHVFSYSVGVSLLSFGMLGSEMAHLHLNAAIAMTNKSLFVSCACFLHSETFPKLQCVVKQLTVVKNVYIFLSSVFMSADRKLY